METRPAPKSPPFGSTHGEEAPSAAGYALVYLFAADGSAVYLSLNHGDSGAGPRKNRERVNRARAPPAGAPVPCAGA